MFKARLELIGELDAREAAGPTVVAEQTRIAPHGLPVSEAVEARRFGLLALNLQFALLRTKPAFTRLRDQARELARLLEEQAAIPTVRDQMTLIQDVQTDIWWQGVTIPRLEAMRCRLRGLIALIEKEERRAIYTDFEDEMGHSTAIERAGSARGTDFAKFRDKAQRLLRAHQDHVAVRKPRMTRQLTATDLAEHLAELEHVLAKRDIGSETDLRRAAAESRGLGLFVRPLVGLDGDAAKEALAGFLAGKTLSADQIEFVNMIVDHLTEHGVVDPRRSMSRRSRI